MKQVKFYDKILILLILTLLNSCSSNDLTGLYSIKSKEKNGRVDTLIIKKDSTYHYLLYDRNCIICNISDKWEITGGIIILKNFENNYFNNECKCNSISKCESKYNIELVPNQFGKIMYLKEQTHILSGITFKKKE